MYLYFCNLYLNAHRYYFFCLIHDLNFLLKLNMNYNFDMDMELHLELILFDSSMRFVRDLYLFLLWFLFVLLKIHFDILKGDI